MKPGIKRIITGVVLFIFGVVIVPLLFIVPLVAGKSKDVQFKAPGFLETSVEKPGRYYLCNDYRTIFNGKSYDSSKNLPAGIEIKIFDSNSNSLPFIADLTISEDNEGSNRRSIGYVDLKNAGKVRIEIAGGAEERIFSFGPLEFFKLVGLFLGAFALSALTAIAGVALSIWGIIKLVKSSL